METILFNRYGKKSQPGSAKPLKDLTAILVPAQLLAEGKRPELVQKIKVLSTFDDARFEQDCQTLINNLLNHCQNLPETSNSYYALPGGLIDHALHRTEAALALFRDYLILDGNDLSEEQKLWLYALLSAGLLQGIGKLQLDFAVTLCDVNGQFIKRWNPLLENLTAHGSYYYYEFQEEQNGEFRKRLNLLLARLLMPAAGFAKLAANPEVLAVWLALLNEDSQGAGTLGAILDRADAIAISRYFSEFLVKNAAARGGRNRLTTFVDTSPESIADKERFLGAEFLDWLKNALGKGQIMINKSPLFTVPGGLLMAAEVFQLFVREHPEYKNWQAIQKSFLALGLHKTDLSGQSNARFEQAQTQQMVSGIVFSKYAVALPDRVQVHNLNTGKVTEVSALELLNNAQTESKFISAAAVTKATALKQLAANGRWQDFEIEVVSEIAPQGSFPRG